MNCDTGLVGRFGEYVWRLKNLRNPIKRRNGEKDAKTTY